MNYNKAEFYAAYGEYNQIPPPSKTEIVFSGRSNVGKSSLINKIVNRKSLARVSSSPGKTATVNFYSLEDLFLVDLPGYGYAKRPKGEMQRWARLVEGYLTSGRGIAIIFQLIDYRHPPTADDLRMLRFMADNRIPFTVILTKADKLTKNERATRSGSFREETKEFGEFGVIEFSSVTGEGTDEIRYEIESFERK